MDEIWERAVETALDGQEDHAAVRTLTLDGVVKCVQGRLPPPSLLEKIENLQQLSIANIGVSSLEQFPRLRNLQKLILSDNRIAGGLEFLVEAGLDSLRDLDLSNNRIQCIEDLTPLAQLKLVSLDLYECPVTRVKDYRSRVFGLIKSLKYLDKMDAEDNERPESDDEEEDEEEDEDDPGSGEIDGYDRLLRISNGHSEGGEGIVDVDEDEDEESDADEEEMETGGRVNGLSHGGNEFRIEEAGRAEVEEDEDGDYDYENDSGEEVDDDDVVEVHDIGDSDDEEEDRVDDDEEDEDEEVDNDEGNFVEPESTRHLTRTDGEIDGHEHGDGDDDDDNGETGEEELGVGEDGAYEGEEEDDDYGEGYLVQPVVQTEEHDAERSDMDPGNEEDDDDDDDEDEDDEEVEDDEDVEMLPTTSSQLKRKRSDETEEEEEEDDVVEFPNAKASKKHG
ncbi:hypothetical protein V6N13_072247 [Hibiscus sabdariffa]|uniref:Acidic leucine-rich nuclear phosphoprotein 32-related protein n=1 Tax=Hibiscus sabdariffa TaxID=183260 RepID=A0ABR2R8N2_9ROSI